MKLKSSLLFIMAFLLYGCAAPPATPLVASGGSRAAGVVEFSYEYRFIDPEPSRSDGLEEALGRCKAWGYKGVLPLNNARLSRCSQPSFWSSSSCEWKAVTYHYQCTIVANEPK